MRAGGRLQLLAPRDGAGGAQSVRGTLDEKNLSLTLDGEAVTVREVPPTGGAGGPWWGWRVRAAATAWVAPADGLLLSRPLPLGWRVLSLLREAAPAALASQDVFETMVSVLASASAAEKDEAAALLLSLLQPRVTSGGLFEPLPAEWKLERLLPLGRALGWYERRHDRSEPPSATPRALPRRACLYAELLATALAHPSYSASPATARQYLSDGTVATLKKLASLGAALVAILDGYRTTGGVHPAPIAAVLAALPPPEACGAAAKTLKGGCATPVSRRWRRRRGAPSSTRSSCATLPPSRRRRRRRSAG